MYMLVGRSLKKGGIQSMSTQYAVILANVLLFGTITGVRI